MIETQSSFTAEILLSFVNAKLFLNKTVREIVNGYEDSLLNVANILDSEKVPTSKFSILGGVNFFRFYLSIFKILKTFSLIREMELLMKYLKFHEIFLNNK